MGYIRTMGAGLAGSSVKIYGNANVNQIQYGNKLQGLPPVTGLRRPYHIYKTKAGGNAPGRFRVFCINQLGGIGFGNKNSQFAPNADGLGWCPNRKNSSSGRTGIHDHDHRDSSVRHHSRGNSNFHSLEVPLQDSNTLLMSNFLALTDPTSPDCPKTSSFGSQKTFRIPAPSWESKGSREWFLVITVPGDGEFFWQKTSYGGKRFPGTISPERKESLYKDIPFTEAISDKRKNVLEKQRRYEGLAYLYMDNKADDFKLINPYGDKYLETQEGSDINADNCHLWSEHNPISQVLDMNKSATYGCYWNDAWPAFGTEGQSKLSTSHSKGAFFVKVESDPTKTHAIIISSSFPYEPSIVGNGLTTVPIIGIRDKDIPGDKEKYSFSLNTCFVQHFYAHRIYGQKSIDSFLHVLKTINPGGDSIEVFSNNNKIMTCDKLRNLITQTQLIITQNSLKGSIKTNLKE